MTKDLSRDSGLSAADKKMLNDIRQHGWQVTEVFRQASEDGPEWAFSIGLFHTFCHPDVIILGLPLDRCGSIVNLIGTEVKSGKHYDAGQEYANLLADPYKCAFQEVDRSHYSKYVGTALWFYEDYLFPLLQCFWPDKNGFYPWQEGCNEYVKKVQPLLYLPPSALNCC